MKTLTDKILFIVFFLLFSEVKSQRITFIKSFDYYNNNDGMATQQTSDGGFMLFGESGSNGLGQKMILAKTDGYGNVLWSHSYGPDSVLNFGISARQTYDHGYILCGSLGGAPNDTLALVKTDPYGNKVWYHTYPSFHNRDVGQSILQTSDSGFIAAGFLQNGATESIYIVKTDTSGNLQWKKSFLTAYNEYPRSIKQVNNNGYIICGSTNKRDSVHSDIYLLRINLNGDSLWTKTFGTNLDEQGNAVDLTSDGGFIITGNDYFSGGDIWLIKTDSSGNQQWVKTYGGPGWDFGYDAKQCADGGFIIAGAKADSLNNPQFYCLKTDKNGILSWDHSFPSSLFSYANSVWQNDDKGFIFLGYKVNAALDSSDFYYVRLDSMGVLFVPSINDGLNIFSIYPNPLISSSILQFNTQLIPNESGAEVVIYDVLGKEMMRRKMDGDRMEIERGSLVSGVYFVRVRSQAGQWVEKMVVE